MPPFDCPEKTHPFDPDRLNETAEPGTGELLRKFAADIQPALEAKLAEQGSHLPEGKLIDALYRHLARAYSAGALVAPLQLPRVGQIPFDAVAEWHDIELHLSHRWVAMNQQTYSGLTIALLQQDPAVEEILGSCEGECPALLGLSAEQIPGDLGLLFRVVTKKGFTIAVAESVARAIYQITRGKAEQVHPLLLEHLIEMTYAITHQRELRPMLGSLGQLLVILLTHPIPDIQQAASVALLWLSNHVGQGPQRNPHDLGLIMLNAARPEEGCELFYQAADEGDARAMYCLSQLNEIGVGCREDPEERKRLVLLAGESGHEGALGECLIEGIGVDQDVTRGREILNAYAQKGDTFAQGSLAGYLIDQRFLPQDLVSARDWMERSARGGNILAQLALANWESYVNSFQREPSGDQPLQQGPDA